MDRPDARALIDKAAGIFRSRFPSETNGLVYGAAPGRIEILGNHTDYNEGFILSAAINRYTVVLGTRKQSSDTIFLYSDTLDDAVSFELGNYHKYENGNLHAWANYPLGVVRELKPPAGFSAVIISNIPMGAGVSSSAAVELATAMFLQQAFEESSFRNKTKLDLALICKKAENEFVGMGCGILDQFTSAMGKGGKVLFIDSRDLNSTQYIDFPKSIGFVIAESIAPHQLVDGKYNRLRQDCFQAAQLLGKPYLRDVSTEEFEKDKLSLPTRLQKCASHIIGENDRVQRGVRILKKSGNMTEFGALMNISHLSSKNDFENSCDEIDCLIECAKGLPGFLGGRIQGGGFGGSTINLVESNRLAEFESQLVDNYFLRTNLTSKTHVLIPGSGAFRGSL